MLKGINEDFSQNLLELSLKLNDCDCRRHQLMILQVRNECPCSLENLRDLGDEIADCEKILTEVKECFEAIPVCFPLVDRVESMLSKALRCVRECQPKQCDSNCRQSCETIRRVTQPYLQAKMRGSWEIKTELVKLLTEVKEKPCLVVCDCSSHLNSVELYGYLHMASLVVSDILRPLSDHVNETFSSVNERNCLVEKDSIHMAVLNRSLPETLKAIKNIKDVNVMDTSHHTALHIATILGSYEARKLLEFGADPNIPNIYGSTPLLLATITQQTNLVELMCSKWAKPHFSNKEGFSAIMLCLGLGDKNLLERMMTGYKRRTASEDQVWMDVYKIYQPKIVKDTPNKGSDTSGKSAGTDKEIAQRKSR